MLICYELFHLHLHPPEILFQVWCSHHSLEVSVVFLACLWQSDKISIISPIRQMIHIACVLKTWTVPPCIVTENKNDGYSSAVLLIVNIQDFYNYQYFSVFKIKQIMNSAHFLFCFVFLFIVIIYKLKLKLLVFLGLLIQLLKLTTKVKADMFHH